MTGLDTPQVQADLATVRSALLGDAEAGASACVAEAEGAAAALIAQAQARAKEIRDAAEEAGRADARRRNAIEHRQARHRARRMELATQRAIYDELHCRVRTVLARVLAEGDLREQLAACARRVLGPEVTLADAPGGGLVGRAGKKYLDLGYDAMTARAIDGLGGGVRKLWEA